MNELLVEVPASYPAERLYAVRTVLTDFLGLPVTVAVAPRASLTTIRDGAGATLELADGLFATPRSAWLTSPSLPRPGTAWSPAQAGLAVASSDGPVPVLEWPAPGPPPGWRPAGQDPARLDLDVLGTAFFFLTRYEEHIDGARDEHGRFPLAASVTASLVDRPVVDEQVEVLWACLRSVWPTLARKRRTFRVFATHDVDHAFAYRTCGAAGLARLGAADVLRDHAPARALTRVLTWSRVRRGNLHADPFNTYRQIMDSCEQAGAECAFYVMPDPDPSGRDPRHLYTLDDPAVADVLRAIASRGHEIGIHPGYRTMGNPALLEAELRTVERARAAAGVDITVPGGRQHYLRWDARQSWGHWDDLGLGYDSTLCYAEAPGFRAGVCHDFPVFDLARGKQLAIRERPLLLMERTLDAYLGLDFDEPAASDVLHGVKDRTRLHGGEFVLLWHNSSLVTGPERDLYRAALAR